MAGVFSVAREFVRLSLSGEECDPLTNLRLQKLLYYSQGWSLILREGELYSEDLQAWRHGPVVPEVYNALPDRGACAIPPDAFATAPDLDSEDAIFIGSIWKAYGQYSAIKLSQMTHDELPWQRAWGGCPRRGSGNDPIAIENLEEFFGRQPVPPSLAQYREDLRIKEEAATAALSKLPALDADRLMKASSSQTPAARLLTTSMGR